MELSNSEIGQIGEKLAVKWLRERGYLIYHTNWRSGRYELDIVAQKRNVLHIIEVKTRKLGGITSPEEAIDKQKKRALKKATLAYMNQYKLWHYDIQFDLIAVDRRLFSDWDVRMIENAIEFR